MLEVIFSDIELNKQFIYILNVNYSKFNTYSAARMAPAIPDRWIPYKACGNVIEGTRLICFKVPLRKAVQKERGINEIWDVDTLLATIPKLGAVIDLTNTARYYSPKELEGAGILHKKIFMPGRILPPQDIVTEFMNAVDDFLGRGCDSLIGIHCTHGLNRTGYMVCRYMRDRLGIDPKEAIQKFEKARGYKIERDNYIADILGYTPPPPFEGEYTNIKPLYDFDFSHDVDIYNEFSESDYVTDLREYSPGKYVKHPDFHKKRKITHEDESSYSTGNVENMEQCYQENKNKRKKRNNHKNSRSNGGGATYENNHNSDDNAQERQEYNSYGNDKKYRTKYYKNKTHDSGEHGKDNTRGYRLKNENNDSFENSRYWHSSKRYQDKRCDSKNKQSTYCGNAEESSRSSYENDWSGSTQDYDRPYDHRYDY
ncbi:hypothetical protein ACJJTC_019743 [Scirpophaga incertulas]